MATNDSEEKPKSLDIARAKKFFQRLAKEPFVAVVVAEDGEVRVFSKDMNKEQYNRIKQVLGEIVSEGDELGSD